MEREEDSADYNGVPNKSESKSESLLKETTYPADSLCQNKLVASLPRDYLVVKCKTYYGVYLSLDSIAVVNNELSRAPYF